MNFKEEFLKIKFIQDLNHPQEIVMNMENMNKIVECHERVMESLNIYLKELHEKMKRDPIPGDTFGEGVVNGYRICIKNIEDFKE